MKKLSLALLLFACTAYGGDVMYTWTDARGTRHFVSRQDDIPARFRSKAKVYDVATGKKLPLSAAPVATNTSPAAPAGAAPQTSAPAPQQTQPQPQPVQPVPAQPPQAAPAAPPSLQQAPGAQPQSRRARRHNTVHEEE